MPGKFKRFNTNKPTKNYKQLKRALKNASKRFNTVKPKPLTNADFCFTLGQSIRMFIGLSSLRCPKGCLCCS